MGLITKGMGAVLKHIKKPAKAFTRAGDKWHTKTKKLQASKKKLDRIRGKSRIIAPMGTMDAMSGYYYYYDVFYYKFYCLCMYIYIVVVAICFYCR